MSGNKVSRNDPCPCGSGKKFKNCCIGKDIDWSQRKPAGTRHILPAPRPRSEPAAFFPGAFATVDARLKEIAKAAPPGAAWKPLVERLSEAAPEAQRVAAYKAVRDAGVLPPDAATFLFRHAIQWIPPEKSGDGPEEEEEADEADLNRHMVAMFRRFGLDDLAELYTGDRLEYDRRHERGRRFFFGPPDELLAARLREKGLTD